LSTPSILGMFGADHSPVFDEPWQAQVFALTVELHRQGVFTWGEWTRVLGARVAAAKRGANFYEHWLSALETILAAKGLADPDQLAALTSAWARAYRDTPHGRPVALQVSALPA
jgi:nitrile hydratase accessory protein